MNVVVKKSDIEGKGVFANCDFKKGEVVLKWDTSHKLTPEQVKKLRAGGNPYVALFDDTYFLVQKPERYVNHSCEANTYAKKFSDVAKRDIKKGEEITADYSEEAPPGMKMKCGCGSEQCRRVIRKA